MFDIGQERGGDSAPGRPKKSYQRRHEKLPIWFLGPHLASPACSKLFPSLYCDFFCAASAAAFSSARAPLRISSIA